jgi:hypothetical protein
MKVVRLSALRTGRLYPPGNTTGTHFCWRLSRLQGHSVTERIMWTKNFNDTTGNWTRYLPACRAIPQPTVPPRAPNTIAGYSAQFLENGGPKQLEFLVRCMVHTNPKHAQGSTSSWATATIMLVTLIMMVKTHMSATLCDQHLQT